MIYLHKILATFVLPIMLVIIVILIGLIKNKKKLICIAIGVLTGRLALFKTGKAQKLLFSGVKMPWDKANKTEG